MILVLRALQGIAAVGISSLTVTLIGDIYVGADGAAAQGIQSSTNSANTVITPIVVGALSRMAWSSPFFLYLATIPFCCSLTCTP